MLRRRAAPDGLKISNLNSLSPALEIAVDSLERRSRQTHHALLELKCFQRTKRLKIFGRTVYVGTTKLFAREVQAVASALRQRQYTSACILRTLKHTSITAGELCNICLSNYTYVLHHHGIFRHRLFFTGMRRTPVNHTCNVPLRQDASRPISPASLMLKRLHEQNKTDIDNHVAQGNTSNMVPPRAPGPEAALRGKPRLLLMGQRR